MSQQHNELSQPDIALTKCNDHEIDLLSLIQNLGENKRLLFWLPFLCACAAAIISLFLTPMYSAKATFIVPERQSATSAVFDQIGNLGGLAGTLSKSSTDVYIALMRSNTVQEEIIAEFDLSQHYKTKTKEDTFKKLSSLVKITSDKKSGLITIDVEDSSPEIATKLANAYLKPFRAVLNRMSIEEAHMRREFFAHQIEAIGQRPFRDPYLQSALMSSMIKQYETARIDEARDSQILFFLDVAKIPERKSSPKRAELVLIVCFTAFALTFLYIFIKILFRNVKNDPANSLKWVLIKKAWKLSS